MRHLRCVVGEAWAAVRRVFPADRVHHRAVLRALRRAVCRGGLGGRSRLCPACREAPPVFRRARAALRYDVQGRRLILPLKHADRQELAAVLAPHMARGGRSVAAGGGCAGAGAAAPRRGCSSGRYNQAALLAEAVGRIAGRLCVPDALVGGAATESLGDKSAAERAVEVADAFAVRPIASRARSPQAVLLIDDVMTSARPSMRAPLRCLRLVRLRSMFWLRRACRTRG